MPLIGSVNRKIAPPPGRFSAQIRPPCAVDDAAADGEPEPDAAAAGAAAAMELLEDRVLLPGRQARTAVGDVRDHLAAAGLGADLDRRARRGVLGGVLQQVDEDLLQQDLVHRHQRQVRREAGGRPGGPRSCSSVRSSATPTTSDRSCHSFCTCRAPASTRIMSSRLADQPAHPMRFLHDGGGELPPRGGRRARHSWSRVLAAPSIEASGVRMSCDSELSSAVRSRSASTSTSDSRLRSASTSRSSAAAVWPASASSRRRRAGSRNSAGSASRSPSTPTVRARDASGRYSAPRAGRVVVPRPGRLAVIEGPLGHGPLALVERVGRRRRRPAHARPPRRAAAPPHRSRRCRAGSAGPRRAPRPGPGARRDRGSGA